MDSCPHKTTLSFQNNGWRYCFDCNTWIEPKKEFTPADMAKEIKADCPVMGNGFDCYRDGLN
jgi:hypothetical protein